MNEEYDIVVIGMGPAGMAVAGMGSGMGLRVCAIEKRKVGGECMNVGCIPSKSLLRMAKARHVFDNLDAMALADADKPDVTDPFGRIRDYVAYINDKKTMGMFEKVDMILGEGPASFVDPHTVEVGDRRIAARRFFIAVGTKPMVPPIPGIEEIDVLTNDNLFDLAAVPRSMVIIGGGAIGCEMAQAFARLGCRCSIIHMDPYLIPSGERDAGELLEKVFTAEGIEVRNARKVERVVEEDGGVAVFSDQGEKLAGERLLVAAGRRFDSAGLKLENAGVKVARGGAVEVDRYLRTSRKHIFAVGDCHGQPFLSHAAMHQGMIALMNCMLPGPMRRDYRKFVVPWTVFTDPQVSHVGEHARSLDARGVKYECIEVRYEDYGAAIAENVGTGFVKVYCTPAGKILGARIVGEGSGEMINEWALAIQKGVRMHDIMMLQHSFPTMGFLSKRVAETWMMKRMESPRLVKMCQRMFRRRL